MDLKGKLGDWLESDGDKAREAMSAFAPTASLTYADKGGIGDDTPLLRRGDKRRIEGRADGELGKGVQGTLAFLVVGEVVKSGQYGNEQRSWKPFTVATTKVPRAASLMPLLICQQRGGLRVLEGAEDALLHSGQKRIALESIAFDERYELFVSEDADLNWVYQLFSPTFIVFLSEKAPEGFAFEYGGKTALSSFDGYRKSTEELDQLREAHLTVVRNMREQVVEKLGRSAPG